jgi:hypothetical protein
MIIPKLTDSQNDHPKLPLPRLRNVDTEVAKLELSSD